MNLKYTLRKFIDSNFEKTGGYKFKNEWNTEEKKLYTGVFSKINDDLNYDLKVRQKRVFLI